MADEEDEKTLSFQDMELDERILKSIARLGWSEPTPVQEAAIPLMLEGRDVLIKARTGSGKTGAFAIPAIQKVLSSKQGSFREQTTSVLILAPYRELCTQIASHVSQLASTCSREVTCVDISPILDLAAQRPLLVACPDIVVSTPTRALMHFKAGNLQLSSLQLLVIDEADLVLTFGHGEQLRALLTEMPRTGRQTALASATLSPDLTEIKALALKRPAILKLEEPEVAPPIQLTHYHVSAEEEEKAVILLVLIKLGLIQGRTLIFVNTVDRCYKLKLFLEQFAIPACVLNSELPAAARCHAVSQFNQGVFDLLIASDERDLENPGSVEETEDVKPGKKAKNKKGKEQGKKKGKRNKDQESGVSRGIDFQFVSNVINFDFPKDIQPYIHRVGRTARGRNKGTALSLVSVSERPLMETVDKYLGGTSTSPAIKPFQFKMEEVEGFRYRARDAWRAVTRIAVREARLKEIRQEVINCKRLSAYFEEHPKDLASLRHDKALHTVKLQPHLAHVPDYIVPASLKRLASGTSRRRRYAEEEGAAAGSSETKVKMGRAEAKYQTWFFTDTEDPDYQQRTGGHMVNTNCSSSHNRKALCCKMSVEFDTFLASDKKWFCHFDDDNYVNVPRLLRLLERYPSQHDWYLGKPSIRAPLEILDRERPAATPRRKISFWFATGGAGFCISRALALKMLPVASGGKFISVGEKIRLPDDVTMGYIVEHLLGRKLTVVEQFHSHLEPMKFLRRDSLPDQISFSHSGHGPDANTLHIEGFDPRLDPTRFLSLHCYLFPHFSFCPR